tara:strand:- start:163 stop:366 length:204 start_codon:yes stop_codon:yes gene_type:complete
MSNILPFIGKKFSENLTNKIVRSEIDQFYYDLFIAPHDPSKKEIIEKDGFSFTPSAPENDGQLNDED